MTNIKYTKTELRQQQVKLSQLQKYLPTLQLKKAMIQFEINQVSQELEQMALEKKRFEEKIDQYKLLFSDIEGEELFQATRITTVKTTIENIAGIEVPVFEDIMFEPPAYFLFDTSFWLESGIEGVKLFLTAKEKEAVLKERKKLFEKEFREISIRVNLFEKIMIPRTTANIKKISIFLGDQQLTAVSQAKAAKRKILQRRGNNDYSS